MMSRVPKEDALLSAAMLLTVIANPRRLLVLKLLSRNEQSVGAIAEALGISQSAVSQHLAKLRMHNLVQTRRDAQTIYYCSDDVALKRFLRTLDKIFNQAHRETNGVVRPLGTRDATNAGGKPKAFPH